MFWLTFKIQIRLNNLTTHANIPLVDCGRICPPKFFDLDPVDRGQQSPERLITVTDEILQSDFPSN